MTCPRSLSATVRFAIAATVLPFLSAGAATAEGALYALLLPSGPAETRLTPGMPPPAHESARNAFSNFERDVPHIAAFAVAPDGAYGWVSGYTHVPTARRAAVARCAAHGSRCRVYAVRAPSGLVDRQAFVASSVIAEKLKTLSSKPTSRAMAVGPEGAFGFAWGFSSARAAISRAIDLCRAQRGDAADRTADCRAVRPVRMAH